MLQLLHTELTPTGLQLTKPLIWLLQAKLEAVRAREAEMRKEDEDDDDSYDENQVCCSV